MLARSGAESAAAAELTMTQDAILALEPPDLAAMATVAVHRDVMVRRNRNISADLPALWARLGAYTRAEALAQSINDPEERSAALQLITDIASPALPAGSSDPDPARLPPPTSSASSGSADEAAELFDAAESTAYTARNPGLRANLQNDSASARGSAASLNTSTQPGTPLIEAYPQLDRLEDVARGTLAMGDRNRAAEIARTIHRDATRSELLAAIIEHAVKAGHIEHAEQIALSIPAGYDQTKALNRLVGTAIQTGSPNGAEHTARALAAIEGVPAALILVAQATWRRGETRRAQALLAEAIDAMLKRPSWKSEDAFTDAVRTMAEMGDIDQAVSAAAGRLRMLLAIAEAACDRGDDARARTLAGQVLQAAAAVTPFFSNQDPLADAAGLLVRLGEAKQASAVARAIADKRRRTDTLVRIVEAALEAGDFATAEATNDLVVDPYARERLLPLFVRAHLRASDHAAAMTTAQRWSGADIGRQLITEVVRHALDEGALDTADALVQAVVDHDVQAGLRIEVARAAVASATPARAQALLEAAEISARSPDPGWRAEALTAAAWALVPHADIGRIDMLAAAAEAAASAIPDAAARMAALVGIAAVLAAVGDTARAERIFEEAAAASSIPCALAEQLATLAQASADRGHRRTAMAQVSAVGSLARWIADPHNRVRAVQARLAAAIHIGDLDQAEDAAHSIEHPDQRQLALIDVARARAATGQTERALVVALTITNADRQADALHEVARLAAREDLDLAERAARAITVRGGQPPALLSVVWEATRAGNLARAERIAASIADQEWRWLGLQAIHAQRDAPPAIHIQPNITLSTRPRRETGSTTTDPEQQAQDLLDRVDAMPDHPSVVRLLAEAMRAGPCIPALASLSRVDPAAAIAAADALLTILR